MMMSSRPRARRNSDPKPYYEGRWAPRRAFQYGKLATNLLLVEAREEWEREHIPELGLTREWALRKLAELAESKAGPQTRIGLRVRHARRVYELLAETNREDS